MLIAEDFVLLALDPDGRPARGWSNRSSAAVGVTGALVAELALAGHLDLTGGRVRVTGADEPDDHLLRQALVNVAPLEGKRLKHRLGSVKHAGWREVVEEMIARGVVGRVKDSWWLPTRHPVADVAAHAHLLARLRAAATTDIPLDARTATLLALAGPCQLLEVVAPERADRGIAKRRIRNAAKDVPAAEAVKATIEAVQASAAAAVIAATAASSG